MNTCPCSRPTELFLCNECVNGLLKDLRGVPDLLNELTTTGAKLDVTGTRGGGGSSERPIGVNIGALELKGTLEHILLAMWMRCGLDPARMHPIEYVEGIIGRIHVLAGHKSAVSYRDQLQAEVAKGNQIIDRQSNTVRLGDCLTPECGTPLVVDEADMHTHDDTQPVTRCTTCGHIYNITNYLRTRTAAALEYNGEPMRAAESVRYLRKRGINITPRQVEAWVKAKALEAVDHDDKGRKLFNLEDVYNQAVRKAA